MELKAALFDADFASPSKVDEFDRVADLGIRWAIPGGVQRIELTIKADSPNDAYRRYIDHLGHRMVIYDTFADKPIAEGQVYEVVPLENNLIMYICAGLWKRINDDLYTIADMADLDLVPPGDDTDVTIKDIIDDATPAILDSDQSNINASGVETAGWLPDGQVGTPSGDCIVELATVGDSANLPMHFYLKSQPFLNSLPQKPLAYLTTLSKSASPDWIIDVKDLAPNGLTISRHIWNLKTDVTIGYQRLEGTHTGLNGVSSLTDSAAAFIANNVGAGDKVVNITDDALYIVDGVTSATALKFTDTTSATWDTSDVYTVNLKVPKYTASSSTAKTTATDYWSVKYTEIRPEMSATQAAEYRDAILDLFDEPVTQQSFVISGGTIKDGAGARWPLWRVIAAGGGYVRLTGQPLDADVFSNSLDRKTSVRIYAMDYQFRSNTLRIVPADDTRLDAILGKAGLVAGQIIAAQPAPLPAGIKKDTFSPQMATFAPGLPKPASFAPQNETI